MRYHSSPGERLFDAFNIGALAIIGILALYPFVYVLGLSLSTPGEIARGQLLWPREMTISSYELVLREPNIRSGYLNTVLRTVLGTMATLLMTALLAYPLSRRRMPFRKQITFYVLFTMLFSGGLVPRYLLIKQLGLIDTLAVLIIPMMLTAFNVIIMKSFFQQIPVSYAEAARIDGASEFNILFRIFIPLSKPALATIALWTSVAHWNSWFDALIFITSDSKQVLQVFLQRIVIENQVRELQYNVVDLDTSALSSEGIKAATVVITILPILAVYPFLQRYFVRGITLGGIKE